MSLPRSVADVLRNHVILEVEGIDRMYLNVYQPKLQTEKQAACFFRYQRGQPVASSVPMGVMSNEFLRQVDAFVEAQNIPVVQFRKGQRKDDVAAEHRASFQETEGILFLGKAQEKVSVFRTEKRTDATGKKYPWIVKSTAMVNQLYFYCIDEDFGPFFLKFCTYFPYNAKLCINGHEYVKRQLAKKGIAFEPLDNGILSCAAPQRLQEICDSLSAAKIDALLRKWLAKLPHPYTAADRKAGHRYDISILQAEFSLTQVLDRPQTGRIFFEDIIRENLDLGRPDQVQLIFQRRVQKNTPGRFRTRVLTAGSSLHCTSTTRTPRSSSTTRKARRCAPRPPSTTPATSRSANGCLIYLLCGRSASKPTDVYWTSNKSATIARSGKTCSAGSMSRWLSMVSGLAPYVSPIRWCRPCSVPCWCFVCCLGVFPTANSATTGLPLWAQPPSPSPQDK
jgi:hypothetical protein